MQYGKKIPLKALTACSRAINEALIENKNAANCHIHTVILPVGQSPIYQIFLEWILDVVDVGKIVPPKDIDNFSINKCDALHSMASMLGVKFLRNTMIGQIEHILNKAQDPGFNVDLTFVRDLFVENHEFHEPLRKAVMRALRTANARHYMESSFCEGIAKLAIDVPAFSKALLSRRPYPYDYASAFHEQDKCTSAQKEIESNDVIDNEVDKNEDEQVYRLFRTSQNGHHLSTSMESSGADQDEIDDTVTKFN